MIAIFELGSCINSCMTATIVNQKEVLHGPFSTRRIRPRGWLKISRVEEIENCRTRGFRKLWVLEIECSRKRGFWKRRDPSRIPPACLPYSPALTALTNSCNFASSAPFGCSCTPPPCPIPCALIITVLPLPLFI